MSKTILITGGTGLIGKPLVDHLLQKGHTIHLLSRQEGNDGRPGVKTFVWDVYKRTIDPKCIAGVDAIVHLAGESIAGKPWTKERKKKIIESRTESIGMICDLLRKSTNHPCKTLISASAIGFYSDRGDELMTEKDKANTDFQAQCCIAWERAADEGSNLGLRVVKLRTGIVLAAGGGAYPQLAKPVKMGIGAPLGSGRQWISWIHLDDAVGMYEFALENEDCKGVYNMVAPTPLTNKELTRAIARSYKKPLWAPRVPGFVLRVVLGEMSAVVLASTKVSAEKIQKAGFQFQFPDIGRALEDVKQSSLNN